MNLFSQRLRVRRHEFKRMIRGYTEPEEVCEQNLVREILFLGRVIFRFILDTEEVPQWYLIQIGALGDRNGWTSKFSEQIDAQRLR